MKRYDFIADTGRGFKVDLKISEHEGEWVRYEDIKHLLTPEYVPPSTKREPNYYLDITENQIYRTVEEAKMHGCIEKELVPLWSYTVSVTGGISGPLSK